jgi:hypothetical protein
VDIRPQAFAHDIEMASELVESSVDRGESLTRCLESSIRCLESSIGLLVPGADLASQATDLAPQAFGNDVEMPFDVVGCLAIHRLRFCHRSGLHFGT